MTRPRRCPPCGHHVWTSRLGFRVSFPLLNRQNANGSVGKGLRLSPLRPLPVALLVAPRVIQIPLLGKVAGDGVLDHAAPRDALLAAHPLDRSGLSVGEADRDFFHTKLIRE